MAKTRAAQDIEDTYNGWWKGKTIKFNNEQVVVAYVEYYGNSVYGTAKMFLNDGRSFFISSRSSFRPRKKDIEVIKIKR